MSGGFTDASKHVRKVNATALNVLGEHRRLLRTRYSQNTLKFSTNRRLVANNIALFSDTPPLPEAGSSSLDRWLCLKLNAARGSDWRSKSLRHKKADSREGARWKQENAQKKVFWQKG